MKRKRLWQPEGGKRGFSLVLVLGALALGLLSHGGELAATPPSTPSPPPGLSRAERAWVESQLARLDLAGKAAQVLAVRAFGLPSHPASAERTTLRAQVRDLRVGGVVLFRSELDTVPFLVDELQSLAEIPLLISADLERSLGFRVSQGPTSLPDAMAIGAIPGVAGEEAARFAGELTGREGRAAGIHWVFAPVADINNNPANPIINLRSFGEDPAAVGRRVAAFIEGARAAGILTAVKHFPGHGDTAIDSHLALPTIAGDRARLDAVELVPFRAAIAAGVDAVMVGHLAVPAIDTSGQPATLSPAISTRLLRDELQFRGLVVTDAMEMRGLAATWMGEAVVQAVLAGADVVLLPADPRVAIDSLVRAVQEGRLTEERLDVSVRRILETKARLGLRKKTPVGHASLHQTVGRPQDVARAEAIAAQALTLVRNEGGILPLAVEKPLSLLHLVMSSDWVNSQLGPGAGVVGEALATRGVKVETRRLGPQVTEGQADAVVAAAASASHVLVSAFVRVGTGKGEVAMDASHARLVQRLVASGRPVVVTSFGSPYLLGQIPEVPVYLCAFSAEEASQKAAVAALFGEAPIGGKLPVSLPGFYALGFGLELPRREMVLGTPKSTSATIRPGAFDELDRLLDGFVQQGAFPGGVVAVGHRGQLVHLRPFGRQTYAADSPPIVADTAYDLASLTKVIVTTTLTMMMVDEGRLTLDAKVASFLPRFVGEGKERVTVRHLLTHSSGMDWWGPLYQKYQRRQEFLDHIYGMPLVAEPGSQMKYSDLGILLLGEILERVTARSLEDLARERIFEPLKLRDTTFRPPKTSWPQIPPTEVDPWRGRLVQGEVHDENAYALGGVAPHAGLFGSAPDLAKFAQMMLWRGVYDHQRVVKPATVELFTQVAGFPAGSSRALGWDTKSPEGSSAGTLFGAKSYGHTGFTGTSLWIDPERELFVILLTNRVFPTRENTQIRAVRPAVADAVVRALADPAPRHEPAQTPAPTLRVRVGLDRVVAGEFPELRGRRLGLVAHAASLTGEGRHALPALREAGFEVVRLFAPEHGWLGQAAAGEKVVGGVDPVSQLPWISLYGERRQPTAADLAGLDALVIDLQDAGVRFYTYVSTLLLCLEAAAAADLPVYVLDRPNPLGGRRVEGPLRDPAMPLSFVSMAPGPLIHGRTLGELASWVNERAVKKARLTVVPLEHWEARGPWATTGLVWVPPSPNLRSAEAALVYPGVALLEGTNISEGRGTDAPFLRFGAPWLDPSQIPLEVPGYRFTATRFVPEASAAAPQPKYLGVECRGWRIEVVDPAIASPYRLGLTLLQTLMRQPSFEWLKNGQSFDVLVGSPKPREQLRAGLSVEQILEADAAGIAAWGLRP